ncbi:5'-3' exoribonuclease 2-like [Selaginella moellendorffii]|uniref:5'-3' exoribonuclease 2-like n=1 Tax=Selaginella moellendorffii TaxID=88036 RepID=UPI000D1C2BFE|nr:5'-3' exoribonuclease 2-like [Selaginella moellendorffii]|eukprot:XP_024529967.1 5'-3' exoribonuclease 2-like [Selaginella moellendorffii]
MLVRVYHFPSSPRAIKQDQSIMGVPGFFAWLVSKHPRCVRDAIDGAKNNILRYDNANLYVDLNTIIWVILESHDCPPTFATFYQEFLDSLRKLVAMVAPTKLVFLALDGRPPTPKLFSKLFKKPCRYNRDASLSSLSSSEDELDSTKGQKGDLIPRNRKAKMAMVRHGTPFMNGLESELRRFVASMMLSSSYDHRWRRSMTSSRLQWIVSTSEEDGEGELKIFNHIRALPFNAHDFHCVVGRDADLIMLALASPLSRKINIVRQTPKDGVMIYKLISIETLVRDFEVQMEEPCSVRLRSTMRDLVFLCFLLGNDFLPGLEALTIRNNGIDKLQQTYMEVFSEAGEFIINCDGHVNMRALERFLLHLPKQLRTSKKLESSVETSMIMWSSYINILRWCADYYFNGVVLDESYYSWENAPAMGRFINFMGTHSCGTVNSRPLLPPVTATSVLNLRPQWLKSC